jgi:uncharacterized membrane protein
MSFAEPNARTERAGPFPLPRMALLPVLAIGLFALFLVFPAPLDDKAQAALHGLCSQRPSHSFTLGERRLPFDARMTGIYGGFLATSAYLALRGRYRVFGLPPLPTILLLVGGVGLMGLDGTNSLLLDLGLWHPYEPMNDLRLATGLLTGIALAVAIAFLLATTLWRRGDANRRVVTGAGEVGLLVLLQVPFALLVRSDVGWLYVPVALALVLSATAVVTGLALVVLTILRRRDNSYAGLAQLDGAAAAALVLGVAVMALIAGGRFWLEYLTGMQPLP